MRVDVGYGSTGFWICHFIPPAWYLEECDIPSAEDRFVRLGIGVDDNVDVDPPVELAELETCANVSTRFVVVINNRSAAMFACAR